MTMRILVAMIVAVGPALAGSGATLEQVDPSVFPRIVLRFSVPGRSAAQALTEREATVREDGKPVGTVELAMETDPLLISLVMDQSGSMEEAMDDLEQAALEFWRVLPAGAQVEIIGFSSRVERLTGFTSSSFDIRSAIEKLHPAGATALYDAMMEGLEDLAAVRDGARPSRRVLVAFTDGQDQDASGTKPQSRATARDVVKRARRSGIPVSMIGLGDGLNRDTMARIAQLTRGVFLHAPRRSELAAIYRDLARRMQASYRLTYTTPRPTPDGTERAVSVAIAGSSPARGTYLAPTGDPSRLPAAAALALRPLADVGDQEVLIRMESSLRTKVDPLWARAVELSVEAAGLAVAASAEAVARAEHLSRESLTLALQALDEADRVLALHETGITVTTRDSLRRTIREHRIKRTRHLTAYREWIRATVRTSRRTLVVSGTAGQPAVAAGLDAGRAGLAASGAGLAAGEAGLAAGEAGLEAGRAGLEAGQRALDEVPGILDAAGRAARAGERAREAGEAAGDAMDTGSSATDQAGDALDSAGDALDAAGDALDAADEALDAAGDATGHALDAAGVGRGIADRVRRSLGGLPGDTGDQ